MTGQSTLIALVAILGTPALIVFAVFMTVVGILPSISPGPQQVFEQHLLALDEERLDDALAYVDVAACGTTAVSNTPQALIDLGRLGYTFSTAFAVEDVWILEDGSEALLGLRTPPNLGLPNVVQMAKVDDEWLLTCGGAR